MSSASIDEILHFWFEELSRKDWFRKDEALDSTIATRFGAIYHELRAGVPASLARHAGRRACRDPRARSVSPQHVSRRCARLRHR